MNTVEHVTGKLGLCRVSGGSGTALAELQGLLEQGVAKAGLDQTRLARRAGLGRTTVSQALRAADLVPSAVTVAALAKVLKLNADVLLDLRTRAAAELEDGGESSSSGTGDGLGRPICACDPYDLEVHPAAPAGGTGEPANPLPDERDGSRLPGYVRRAHDEVLARTVRAAVEGRSGMAVLVGSSSTGKTRACWEAIQPLAEHGWRLWHPFDPTRAEAALADLRRVGPHTVVWLNDAQHSLGDPRHGPDIAAAVRSLLTSSEAAPVLVLGTLWPEFDRRYTALPRPGEEDQYAQVRALLTGRTVAVPEAFDDAAQDAARELASAGDQILAAALERAEEGRVTQDLAGAPELLRRYRTASAPARAVLHAAMDARRLGVGPHMPLVFLTDACIDYLSDREHDALPVDWAEKALAELAEPVHGHLAPLRRTRPRPARRVPGAPVQAPSAQAIVYRLADYLEQQGRAERRHMRPPASFWQAARQHLTDSQDLAALGHAAERRHRLQWAYHLYQRVDAADASRRLPEYRIRAGDWDDVEKRLRDAIASGSQSALFELVAVRLRVKDLQGAEDLLFELIESGDPHARAEAAEIRWRKGDLDGAESFLTRAADAGAEHAVVRLAVLRREAGDSAGAEQILVKAANAGNANAAEQLRLHRRHELLRRNRVHQQPRTTPSGPAPAPKLSPPTAPTPSDPDPFIIRAAEEGDPFAMVELARFRRATGKSTAADELLGNEAAKGAPTAFFEIARVRRAQGDLKGAQQALLRADEAGHPQALVELFLLLEHSGDHTGAETVVKRALDAGKPWGGTGKDVFSMWPYGLDPDGRPTPPW
ncbi:helix-turn-helix domain-containing protein [Streptomyces sp. NPDC001135]